MSVERGWDIIRSFAVSLQANVDTHLDCRRERLVPHQTKSVQNLLVIRERYVRFVQLFNVHIFERNHSNVADETHRAVHVPYPTVGHAYFVVHVFALSVRNELHRIGEVKPPIGFNNIGELAGNIPVLAV